jgi:choline kinase
LTENKPKSLLKINEMTLLERFIKTFVENNVNKFIFVVGHFKEKVEEFSPLLEKKYNIDVKIVENEKYDVTNTSCSTYLASSELDEDFILINGDNVLDSKIVKKVVNSENTAMVIDNDKKLNEESFKVIIENGIIKEIGKELDIKSSTGEFIGVSKVVKKDLNEFNNELLTLIEEDPQNYYDFAYKNLSKTNKIDFILTNGLKWTEIDDFDDWNLAKKIIKDLDSKS